MKLKLFLYSIIFCSLLFLNVEAQQLFSAKYSFAKTSVLSTVTELSDDSSLIFTGYRALKDSLGNSIRHETFLKTNKSGIPILMKEYALNSPYYTAGIQFVKQFSSDSLVFIGFERFLDTTNGYTHEFPFIGKMDIEGNVSKVKGFKLTMLDYIANTIFITADSGYMFCGSTSTVPAIFNTPPTKGFLMKLDRNLNQVWCKQYSDTVYFFAGNFLMLPDGGFAITGYTQHSDTVLPKCFIMRTDSLGNVIWAKRTATVIEGYVGNFKIILTRDNALAIAYVCNTTLLPANDVSFAKVDLNGTLLWHRFQGEQYDDDVTDIVSTKDSGFIMFTPNLFRKFDSNGSVLSATAPNLGFPAEFFKMIQNKEGGFVLAGLTNTTTHPNMLVLKSDSSGFSACNNNNFTNLFSIPSGMSLSSFSVIDSSIIFPEVLNSFTTYDSLPVFQYICFTGIENNTKSTNLIAYPNPVNNHLNIKCANGVDWMEIYNLQGILINKYKVSSSSFSINVSELNPGMFIIKFYSSKGEVLVRKIMKTN